MIAAAFDPKSSHPAFPMRLPVLGLASVLVYFITLSAPYLVGFAAFPLVVAAVLYKRPQVFSLMLACSLVVFLLLWFFDRVWAYALFPLYLLACSMAVVVGEVLLREVPPVRAVLNTGVFLAVVIFLGGGLLVQQNQERITGLLKTSLMGVQDQLQVKQSSAPATPARGLELRDQIQVMIDRADEIVASTPVYVFLSLFLGVWFNLYLVLRGHRTLRFLHRYPYGLRDLTRLRLPSWTAYLAVVILGLYVLPVEMVGAGLQSWSQGAVYVLGIFFFLQGFGVYLEYLDAMKIRGFLRSLLVLMTVVFANAVLAGMGLFDLWFDFRRFFSKKGKKL